MKDRTSRDNDVWKTQRNGSVENDNENSVGESVNKKPQAGKLMSAQLDIIYHCDVKGKVDQQWFKKKKKSDDMTR